MITYDSVGSGEGIRRFIGRDVKNEDQVDFGASDAAMQDNQIAQVPDGVVMLPVTAGGVVLAYNVPGVPQGLRLSRRAYAGIFLGEIKNWNDPLIAAANPGVKLPKLTIVTVVRQDASGTTFAFTKHLDAISEKWRSQYGPSTLVDWPGNAMRAKGNEGVAGCFSSMPSAAWVMSGTNSPTNTDCKPPCSKTRRGSSSTPDRRKPPGGAGLGARCRRICASTFPTLRGPTLTPLPRSHGFFSAKTMMIPPRRRRFATFLPGAWAMGNTPLRISAISLCLPIVVEKGQAALQTIKP